MVFGFGGNDISARAAMTARRRARRRHARRRAVTTARSSSGNELTGGAGVDTVSYSTTAGSAVITIA